jgi:hypothetical protein
MAIMELGEHLDALFQCQLLKIAAAMAGSFKLKNLSKSLLGRYECQLK